GSYAYVADRADGLRIIDVSTPSSPVEVGFCDTIGYAYGVAISGIYAYVAAYEGGLRIIDVSTPSNPTETGFYDTVNMALGVAVSGNYAYVADKWDGLRIIDVSNPSNPTEAGFYDTGSAAWGVAVSEDLVYVADMHDGLYIIRNDIALSVEDDNHLGIPIGFALNQNYPNPFNPETTISFLIPKISKVEISIYNIKGQKIKTLVNKNLQRGHHEILWNGKNENGEPVSSGIYFYKMETDNFSEIKKAILLK
ncbi:MAG: T9SS type A sorting domain-containing protein, partial [Bacteroidales bacterium]|nr:T9SS type A sorting domain-containing protein [Bacteroidales bacterium]